MLLTKEQADKAWNLFLSINGSVNSCDPTNSVVGFTYTRQDDGYVDCTIEVKAKQTHLIARNVLLHDGTPCEVMSLPLHEQKDHSPLLELFQ